MKLLTTLLSCLLIVSLTGGCLNRTGKNSDSGEPADTTTIADTGFTGIRQYYSKDFLSYEVTFKNGIRQGLMKTYYASGKLRTTFWYENGMKEDTAVWYFEDGKVFRKTPFRRDSMNGIQIQYYRSGRVRAKLKFENGLRVPYLKEFTDDGKEITDYPSVVTRTNDEYSQNGSYKIFLELDKKNIKATYYRGEYVNGLFEPKVLKKINNTETTGYMQLRKTGTHGDDYVVIISEISTPLGNKLLVYNRINLPYNDLK